MGYRYIGSKEKLAPQLIDIMLSSVPHANSAIDLMAGTGNMSLAFRRRGLIVSASDVMTYSYHHLIVNLLLNSAPSFNGLIGAIPELIINSNNNYNSVLKYLNSASPTTGYFYTEFSPGGKPLNASKPRMYYTEQNAGKIDSIRSIIHDWKSKSMISDCEHSLLLHNLIVDSNDIANIAGTYGHYLSHFVERSLSELELKPISFESDNNIQGHTILRGYAEEIASKLIGDFCYIDPPYIKRQYAANYHILETIAREDFPEAVGESGLRPWRDQYSNFCSKIKIRNSFTQIISNLNCQDIFISYSEDGLLSLNDLIDFLSSFGEIRIHTIEYKRFKSNNSKKSSNINEFLIHLRK